MRLPRRPRLLLPVAIALVAIVVLFFLFAGIFTDYLWYNSVGYTAVFSGVIVTQILLFVVGALMMVGVVGGNMLMAYRMRPMFGPGMFGGASGADRYRMALDPHRKLIFLIGVAVLGLFAGSSFSGQWKTWLEFINGTPFGETDPLFEMDISFFMFTYPFLRMVLGFLFTTVVLSAILAAVVHYLYGGFRLQSPGMHASRAARVHLSVLLGLFVLLKAVAYWIDRYGLVFSDRGFRLRRVLHRRERRAARQDHPGDHRADLRRPVLRRGRTARRHAARRRLRPAGALGHADRRGLPGAGRAVPGQAEPAGQGAGVHQAQHRRDPKGVRRR